MFEQIEMGIQSYMYQKERELLDMVEQLSQHMHYQALFLVK